jgi:hypothetical protein
MTPASRLTVSGLGFTAHTRRAHSVCIILALSALSACVTERVPREGSRPFPSPSKSGSAAPVTLPDSPVATPANRAQTVTARAQVAILPLGSVQYDGQRLPLVSGDGLFVAVQSGDAPGWGTILADRSQEPAIGTRLRVYALATEGLRPIEWAQPPEPGWMLASGSDSRGFIAERVEPDGSRNIARIGWLTGEVEMLVRDGRVNTHASLTPQGELIYIRRPVASAGPWELVMRDRTGRESVALAGGDGAYIHPVSSADGSLIYTLVLSPAGLEVRGIRVVRRSAGDTAASLGSAIVRRTLEESTDAIGAHQVGTTMRPGALTSDTDEAPSRASLVMFSPRNGRAALLDPTVGAFVPLAAKSITAAPSPTPTSPGYYCTTPDGLVFAPWGVKGPAAQGAVLFDEPFVAWPAPASPGIEPGLILIGPVKGQADRLALVRMFEVPAAQPPKP